MIRTTLYISKYDWIVHCYFAVDDYYAHEICSMLAHIGASRRIQADAWNSMCNGSMNSGITYSNYDRRRSVMVTQITSSSQEFFNSFVHETGHLATHIAIADGIDLKGEEVRYIQGDVAMALFPHCKELLCDCCRRKGR